MLVSVIIPTKNEEENIEQLLKLLKKQSFKDFEVIVADANSTDKTREIAKSLGALVVDGGMPSVGRNRGAVAANGSIFMFMDADAIPPEKHFLRDVIKEFHRRRLDVAALQIRPISAKLFDKLMYGFYNRYSLLLGSILPHAVGTCMIAKKYIHETLGGFDETITLAEDMEYARRASYHGLFGIIKSHHIHTPMRRLDKEGRIRAAVKYVYSEFYMLLKGPIRGSVKYDFDYTDTTVDSK